MKPCEFCIEEECEGKYSCDCSKCEKQSECPKRLKPTIRITTKCTQSCSHCCFKCSPEKKEFMSIKTAKKIKKFLLKNKIKSINLMGGEFYCNRDWKEILSILISSVRSCRLVTNGDWAGEENVDEFIYTFKKYPDLIVAISDDQWHDSKYIQIAKHLLEENNILYDLPLESEITLDSVVPIGRAEYEYNMYSTFFTYCSKPDRKYSFLIDENGFIFKCCFGIWEISDVEDSDFLKSFKSFNQKFYNVFIPNCKSCIRSHKNIKKDKI